MTTIRVQKVPLYYGADDKPNARRHGEDPARATWVTLEYEFKGDIPPGIGHVLLDEIPGYEPIRIEKIEHRRGVASMVGRCVESVKPARER